jgi:hypothetical protein
LRVDENDETNGQEDSGIAFATRGEEITKWDEEIKVATVKIFQAGGQEARAMLQTGVRPRRAGNRLLRQRVRPKRLLLRHRPRPLNSQRF